MIKDEDKEKDGEHTIELTVYTVDPEIPGEYPIEVVELVETRPEGVTTSISVRASGR